MKTSIASASGSMIPKVTTPVALAPKSNINFKSLYDSISSKQTMAGFGVDAPLAQISRVRLALEKSQSIAAKDILLYQIQISELNLRVELISKAADSAVALTRKLQNAQ
jgi:hypothetical protein